MKKFYKVVLILIAGLTLYINIKLYYRVDEVLVSKSIPHQFNYLEKRMKDGAAERMQEIFPEGYFFMNLLYGLSWAEYGNQMRRYEGYYNKALQESEWALKNLQSDEGQRVFDNPFLSPPNGAFYSCWTNYLRSKRIRYFKKDIPETEIADFKRACDQLAAAFDSSESPYLESYDQMTWPADNLPGMASLKIHDELFGDQYAETRFKWLVKVQDLLDTKTGLIPHAVKYQDGSTLEGARGSSQSLMNIILPDIDRDFGRRQYLLYKKHFIFSFAGLPIVREYPKGTSGFGDIDSGPVVFGVGAAATVVGFGTMTKYGDKKISSAMRSSIEAFGFPVTLSKEKRFLFGAMAVGDAFLLWAELQEPVLHSGIEMEEVPYWRLKFHLASLVFLIMLALPVVYWGRKGRIQ